MNPLETVKKAAKKLADTTKKAVGTVVPMVGVATALNVGTPEYLEAEEKPKTQQVTNDDENQNEYDTFDVRALNELDLLKLLLFVRPYHREYNSTTHDIGVSLPHLFVPTGKTNEYYDLLLYLGDKKLKSYKSKKNNKDNALDAVKNIVKNMSTFDLLKQSELFFEQQTSNKLYKECQNLYAQLNSKYEFTYAQKTVFFVLYYLNSEDLKTVLNEINRIGNENADINTIFAKLAHKKTKTEDIAILYWLNALYVDMISFDTISEMKVSSFETAITGGQKLTFKQFLNKVFYDNGTGKFKLSTSNIRAFVKTAKSKTHKTKTLDKNGNTPYIGDIVDNAEKKEILKNKANEQEKQKWVQILGDILKNTKDIKKYTMELESPLFEDIDNENKLREISEQQTQKPDIDIATETKPENKQKTKNIKGKKGTTEDDPYKVRVRSEKERLSKRGSMSTDTVKLTEEEKTEIAKVEKELEKEIKERLKELSGYLIFNLSGLSGGSERIKLIKKQLLPYTFPLWIIKNYFYETQFYDGGKDFSGNLTSFSGLTWLLDDSDFDGKQLFGYDIQTIWTVRAKNFENIKIPKNEILDFFWSLTFKQKLDQSKLFLTLPAGDGILDGLIKYAHDINEGLIKNPDYFKKKYGITLSADDLKNEISARLLLSVLKISWQNPKNGKDVLLRLSPYGGKETADYAVASTGSLEFGTLKRVFWLYLDVKGKIDTQTYLILSVDGIATLLDAFVTKKCEEIGKPVSGTEPRMQDYINAGVFIELKKPISLKPAYKDYQELVDKKAKTPDKTSSYAFTADDKLIAEIIKFAKEKSADDQKNGERNTVLHQIAYDLYRFNIPVKEFFDTSKNITADLNPVQKVLFERVKCLKKGTTKAARMTLIKHAKETLQKVTDPETKKLLERIIKEESQRVGNKVKDTKVETKKVENTKSKKPSSQQTNTQTAGYTTITIRSDDTLGSLAQTFKTTVSELKELNDLKSSDIRAGDKLRIKMDCMYITIQSDDTLGSLADKYKTTVPVLRALNGLKKSSNKIYVGKKLLVPKPKNKRTSVNEAREELRKRELAFMSMLRNKENY